MIQDEIQICCQEGCNRRPKWALLVRLDDPQEVVPIAGACELAHFKHMMQVTKHLGGNRVVAKLDDYEKVKK